MNFIKKQSIGLVLTLFCILLSSCVPSPEKLAATIVAGTAAAATSTPTKTPTPITTSTPTPTPTPKPDSKAMLKWREVGFPDEIIAIPPDSMGVEEEAHAFSLETWDGSTRDYYISGGFAFIDDWEDTILIIYGFTALLPSSNDRDAFDNFTLEHLYFLISSLTEVPQNSVSQIKNAKDIGDVSNGVTTQYNKQGETWEISLVSFRVNGIGAWVFILNDASMPSPVSIEKVALVYADSIQRPVIPCKFISIEPDTTSDVPTFIFEAEGFYPYDRRIITLSGVLIIGDELKPTVGMKMGMGGESADKNGNINESISIYTEDSELSSTELITGVPKVPLGPIEYTLNVKGTTSGCEIEEIVTWPGETAQIGTNAKAVEHFEQGFDYKKQGLLDLAIEEYSKAIALNLQFWEAYYNRANIYHYKRNLDQAIADYNLAIALNPKYAEAYSNRGLAYFEKGDPDRAIADYDRAIELNPQFAIAYHNRGIAYANKGDFDRAIADYDRAIEINPQLAEAYSNRGFAYFDKGDPDRAIADCDRAIEINPNHARAYNHRGIAYRYKGNLDQAIADFNQAITLNPEFVEAYYNRGLAYESESQYGQALSDLNKYIEIDASDASAYYFRGSIYAEIGEQEKAISDLEKALDLGLDPSKKQDAEELLKELR